MKPERWILRPKIIPWYSVLHNSKTRVHRTRVLFFVTPYWNILRFFGGVRGFFEENSPPALDLLKKERYNDLYVSNRITGHLPAL